MSTVDLDFVQRTMGVLLERTGRPVVYDDPANGQRLSIGAREASATDGFLPAFLVAGEAIWREATGKGFELDIARDASALLGYRVRGVGGGTFTSVMLASMEAMHQVARPEAIMVSDFNTLWRAAIGRIAGEVKILDPGGIRQQAAAPVASIAPGDQQKPERDTEKDKPSRGGHPGVGP